MADPYGMDGSYALDARSGDRDAKIEQLLLIGLDHYFGAQYEQAINVWTRALFLDRNHARARAYIERARSALAERQRRSEELLQDGVAAFHRGDGGEARRLLRAAIDEGAPADEAFTVLSRLDRLERVEAPLPSARPELTRELAVRRAASDLAPPTPVRHGASARLLLALAGLLVVAAIGGAIASTEAGWPWVSLLPLSSSAPPAAVAPGARDLQLPVPRRGEMLLMRARALAATGRLHDALRALDRVRLTDAERPEADRLRIEIQRKLLALVSAPPAAASAGSIGGARREPPSTQ